MNHDYGWNQRFELDLDYGFLNAATHGAPLRHHPQIVVNDNGDTVLGAIRAELKTCTSFVFSVAFVSPQAIAFLKQDLVEFEGRGRFVTSDYLGFNSPAAFSELLALQGLPGDRFDVRVHRADGFHPKGYIFEHARALTMMMGSSNLTANALTRNHEWNLKVSAAPDSDLARQVGRLIEGQRMDSAPLSEEWIERYRQSYRRPGPRPPRAPADPSELATPVDFDSSSGWSPPAADGDDSQRSQVLDASAVRPNTMQRDALDALAQVRSSGEKRAIIISATGTGKTILSALDVRAVAPRRLLFVVHREQILDRTIGEYRRVLGGSASDYGKLTGSTKDIAARYLFATVQTLSQPQVLQGFAPDLFDYVIIDEAHRAGSASHRRVVEHFDPVFMLAMTATPERTDGFNVFELFDYNVPYEIRLGRALEEGMLSPFHYYGISEARFDDGSTVTAETELSDLISPGRVAHLVGALDTYGQAGVAPRGLIFCGRTDEARSLSDALNERVFRGRRLRTRALTGRDSVDERERAVEALESGELDYLLSVDIFNEGVDIPSVNQVVMLRETQSAIVFVQQMGRGLRKHDSKEYLVVIDFIGNYASNFLIPIALFGNESLNKESLRRDLIAAEEAGVLPGLSSVHFDKIARQRVLDSIRATRLDDMARLKSAILAMRNRVGAVPRLWDFFRFESVDPVLLATRREHYPALVSAALKEPTTMTGVSSRALQLISHEVLPSKRGHEFVLLRALLDDIRLSEARIAEVFAQAGLPAGSDYVRSAVDSLTLDGYADADVKRYGGGIVTRDGLGNVEILSDVAEAYRSDSEFTANVDDLIETGRSIVSAGYEAGVPFKGGVQYTRKEVLRQLCWPRSWVSTLYGYKVDRASGPVPACPIFVTLHKGEDVSLTTAYEDRLVDHSTMLWFTRSRRTLRSDEVRAIASNEVKLFVFVKKDDAEGSNFYFLGEAVSRDAVEATMADDKGGTVSVVKMLLEFDAPIDNGLFEYFHPSIAE